MRTRRMIGAAVLTCTALALLAGCELTTTSPWSGRPVTAGELAIEQQAELQRVEREQRDKADAIADAQRRRTAEFGAAVARLDAETQLKVAELKAIYEADTAAAEAAVRRLAADTEAAVAEVRSRGSEAMAGIERRLELLEGVAGVVAPALGAVPGGGLALAGLTALVGYAGASARGARRAREEADKAWDEGAKAAHAERDARDRTWDESESRSALASLMASIVAGRIQPPQPGA